MSYFYGRDLWNEMDRVNGQIASLLQNQGQMDDDDDYDDDGNISFVVLKPSKIEEPLSREESDEEPEEQKKPQKDKKPQCQCKMETNMFYDPPADIAEDDKRFVIAMDLPGVKKEDIKMDFHQNRLTISGVRKPRYLPSTFVEPEEKKEETAEASSEEAPKKEEQPKMKVLSCNCSCGEFERIFTVPSYCTAEDISAKMEDGVLFITVQKPKIPEPHKINIM